MSELIININLDNAAFGDNPREEVANILEYYVEILKSGNGLEEKFRDFNGNSVGEAKVVEYPMTEKELPEEKQRIVVGIEGGMVQWIAGENTGKLEIAIVDWDAEGGEYPVVKDSLGYEHEGNLYRYFDVFQDKKAVDNYFNQLED